LRVEGWVKGIGILIFRALFRVSGFGFRVSGFEVRS
jgi:hypothetical protein